ncbi:Hypothetical Protein U712_07735 [Bacillus subtilis PY79]|nr:Hypothetical Protein U712_07735 [Bacillus subtilis PY79]AKN13607.1 hypothetical protein ABU16_2531 [Bacillus subtilis]EME07611.1 hypothetical protein BS732_2259 [Bacillus subtilis MB73/2]KZD76433.1 hypothetical protein B4417_3689 [Bacillus subtilis]
MWTESLAFIKCALAAASLFMQIRSGFLSHGSIFSSFQLREKSRYVTIKA